MVLGITGGYYIKQWQKGKPNVKAYLARKGDTKYSELSRKPWIVMDKEKRVSRLR